MKEMIKYLIIAVIVGGAIPIILSNLTRKRQNKKQDENK
jgi:hypothetical protein